jgi:hypothetical protein
MQIFLLWKNGIVTDGESRKYIYEANLIETEGRLSTLSYSLYFTQILLISIISKLGLGYLGVVVVQLFLNLVATIQFHRLAESFSSANAALIATLLLVFNYPFQEFNTFLQTESIFYSLSIITSCFLLRQTFWTWRNSIVLIILLSILSVTRPTGILFLPPVLLYLFFRFLPQISLLKKVIIVGAGSLGFFFMLNAALGSGGELDFMLPYRDERIICGVPTLPEFVPINEASNANSVYGLIYYVFNNFGQFTRLAWLRSLAFFGLIRSYYSLPHNIYLILYFYPIYILVLVSVKVWIRRWPHQLFYFMVVNMLVWITVMLSCDDWHNRFFLSIFPYLLLIGLPTLERLLPKRKTNGSSAINK